MVTGTLLICQDCGDCEEFLGEQLRPQHIAELKCEGCGGQLEPPEREPRRAISHEEFRGG